MGTILKQSIVIGPVVALLGAYLFFGVLMPVNISTDKKKERKNHSIVQKL